MALQVARFVNLLLAALVAGILVAVWLLERALHELSGATYTAVHQPMARTFGTAMPLLVIPAAASGLAVLLLLARAARTRAGAAVACGVLCSVVVALVSALGDVPINRAVLGWSIQAPPADWAQIRDRWVAWHGLRTACAIAALCCYLVGALAPLPRRVERPGERAASAGPARPTATVR